MVYFSNLQFLHSSFLMTVSMQYTSSVYRLPLPKMPVIVYRWAMKTAVFHQYVVV